MRAAGLAGAVLLAACSQQPQVGEGAANVATSANAPVPEPTTALAPAPSPSLSRDVGEPAIPEPGAPRPTTSLAEGPFAPDSGQAGANVVQTYVALLEQGRVRQALELWEPRAAVPTLASLNQYRDFHANVGGPGRIEGAAGSRYVTVPVHFTGTLKSGGSFVEDGAVTLRRVGEVDGATPAQKRWRIYSVDVKPVPPRR